MSFECQKEDQNIKKHINNELKQQKHKNIKKRLFLNLFNLHAS